MILPAQVTNPGLRERMKADPNLETIFLRGIPRGLLGRDIKGPAMWTGLRSGIRWLIIEANLEDRSAAEPLVGLRSIQSDDQPVAEFNHTKEGNHAH